MTSTAVVLGMAPLGKPWPASGWDCAKDRGGSTARRKGIMNFIGSPLDSVWCRRSLIEYDRTLLDQKNLLFSEALYEKSSRLHQELLTPLGIRTNASHHQDSRHAGEQQPDSRLFLFSGLSGNEWYEPLTIRFQKRLDPFSYGYRFAREFRPQGGPHASCSRRIQV